MVESYSVCLFFFCIYSDACSLSVMAVSMGFVEARWALFLLLRHSLKTLSIGFNSAAPDRTPDRTSDRAGELNFIGFAKPMAEDAAD